MSFAFNAESPQPNACSQITHDRNQFSRVTDMQMKRDGVKERSFPRGPPQGIADFHSLACKSSRHLAQVTATPSPSFPGLP